MMDILTKEKRSWNMSRIRGKNTKPELVVRSFLHHGGFRYRIHQSTLPGKPDVVLSKYKTVIFVHGCFWHRHKGCKYAYAPKTRKTFWKHKFIDNVNRFRQVRMQLAKIGWKTLIIWECETDNIKKLSRIMNTLKQNRGI